MTKTRNKTRYGTGDKRQEMNKDSFKSKGTKTDKEQDKNKRQRWKIKTRI
jgi:hypothetical protein